MERREWAHVKGQKTPKRLGETDIEFCARVAKAEHARAVRIARQVVKHAAHMEQQTRVNKEANAYWQGKLDGAENILTSLQKGRA